MGSSYSLEQAVAEPAPVRLKPVPQQQFVKYQHTGTYTKWSVGWIQDLDSKEGKQW